MIGGLLSLIMFCGLAVFAAWQILPVVRRIRRPESSSKCNGRGPCVQVVLSLKGLDPFLERCLERLASQDYSNYRVTVVVDSVDDPAWSQAWAARREFGDLIDVRARAHDLTTCTRKLCNLLTAFDALPSEVEIVALCDGDAVVHESWLSELVAGLADPQVAAVGANRWYSPPRPGMATLSRHYWNAIAVPNTHQYAILWAGSLAIRRSIIDEASFREAFARGFADDTVMARYLHETGRISRLLEGTYVVISETTSIAGYWNFLVRQMLCVRIHHPRWTPILIHAVLVAVAMLAVGTVGALGSRGDAALAASGLALYAAVLLGLLQAYDTTLRRTFPDRAALHVPIELPRMLMMVPALALTSVIYPAATIAAACARRHLWRGVEYHLKSGRVVRAVDRATGTVPVRPVAKPAQEKAA